MFTGAGRRRRTGAPSAGEARVLALPSVFAGDRGTTPTLDISIRTGVCIDKYNDTLYKCEILPAQPSRSVRPRLMRAEGDVVGLSAQTEKAKRAVADAVDRGSKVPLYLQIEGQVRKMLASGGPTEGRIFTEQALADRFGVSRMTVRQAIRDLVGERLIYRVRGAGTFIAPPGKITESLEHLRDNFADWESQGKRVDLRLLEFATVEAGSDVARRLQIPERTPVPHLLRLWLVDGEPIGLVYFYLHPTLAGKLSRADVAHTHVRVAVARRLRIPLLGERVEIEAATASSTVADRLGLRPGAAVLIRRVTQFYGEEHPLVAANCYYRGDLYRYSVYVPSSPGTRVPAPRGIVNNPVTVQARASAQTTSPALRPRRPRPGTPP